MFYKIKSGFTIVEMIVAITLGGLVILSIAPSLLSIIGTLSQDANKNRVISEVNTALSTISSDAARNYSFLTKPNGDLDTKAPAPSAEDGGWSYKGFNEDSRTLMLELPATTLPYTNPNRELVYNKLNSECTLYTGTPVTYTAIYYLNNSNLYKRTYMNQELEPCTAPFQKNSCMDSSCPLNDVLIAKNVSKFKVDYHDSRTATNIYPYSTIETSGLSDIPSATITLEITAPVSSSKGYITLSNKTRINVHPFTSR